MNLIQKIGAAFAAITISAFALPPDSAWGATEHQWRRDIDDIVAHITAVHPRPWGEIGRVALLREAAAVQAELAELSEEERVVRTMQLVALIGDRATALEPDTPTFGAWYPIRLYQFTDGIFITAAHSSVSELAGAEVLEVGGFPVDDAVAIAQSMMSANGPHGQIERLFAIHNAGLMRGAGVAEEDGALRVRVRLADGDEVERRVEAVETDDPTYSESGSSPFGWTVFTELYGTPIGTHEDWVTAVGGASSAVFRDADDTRPLHLAHRRVFYSRAIPDQDAYYAQINYMSDWYGRETFEEFFARVLGDVDEMRPRRFIVDLRFNGGGDGSKALRMAHEIIRRGPEPPWDELYVLIGRRTAGGAVSAIDAFVRNTPTTLVGEPTGGQFNSISDSRVFLFDDTRIRLSVAATTSQFVESTDLSETILPDVPAAWSFTEWRTGRDPAVDAILSGEEIRSVAVIAHMNGGAVARANEQSRREAFQRFTWWRPMRFNVVKSMGYDLLREERAEDAVEMFTLMTELYPDHWNSWESLGRAQTATGDLLQARASYRCALALDPENFDSGDLRTALAEAPDEASIAPAGCPVEPGNE